MASGATLAFGIPKTQTPLVDAETLSGLRHLTRPIDEVRLMSELPALSNESREQSVLLAHFLARLSLLVQKRLDLEEHLNALGLRMLDRAIQATLRDCRENGGAEKARTLTDWLRRRDQGRIAS